MKKPLIGADLILSLGFIAYLYFDIKSDGDGSFLKGLKEMTSDVVFWYIVLALIIFAPIVILYAKKLEIQSLFSVSLKGRNLLILKHGIYF